MQRKSPKLLEDNRDAAAFVRQATAGKTLDLRLMQEIPR
jgi:hypothetical protein